MSTLGIYFGPKIISLVEAKAKKLINVTHIPWERIQGAELEEKVPDEVKIVALFKEELRKNKIEAKEAALSLSGKDLIIRTFEMPVLPRGELEGAINFEAKKYIPFKVEDMIFDFQAVLDKASQKNLVLFIGIKKEIIDKYLSILKQLELKVISVEYSAFSILRLLELSGLSDKNIASLLSVDFQEEDEASFMVLENGFPLFSRDIALGALPGEISQPVQEHAMILEKLKTEMRVSLDYYRRKFPAKEIKKLAVVTDQSQRSDLEALDSETGLSVQFIDTVKFKRIMVKPVPFSLGLFKAYSSSLAKITKGAIKIDLLAAKERAEFLTKTEAEAGAGINLSYLLAGLKVEPKVVTLGLLACFLLYMFGLYQKLPLQRELTQIMNMRSKVSALSVGEASYEKVSAIAVDYNDKMKIWGNLIKKQLYLTLTLDVLPRVIPKSIWLSGFSFKKDEDRADLTLRGFARLEDSDKELEAVNTFLASLKESPGFNKYFKQINIVSVERSKSEGQDATSFVVSCRN